MKKMIAWLLLVVMLLGVFAGCDNTEQNPTTEPSAAAGDQEGINAAIDYLKAFYKDEGSETFTDFERFGIVRIDGVPYTVVWTADVSEDLVKAVVNEDGTVTIDVNENCEESTPYVLTATITDDAGNTASHSWNYILPVGIGSDYGAIVDMAYELEKDQAMEFPSTLVGTVTAINTAWDDAYQNITVTIVVEGREDKPIQCYRLKGDGAKDLAPGDLITVTGTLKNYNGTIEFDSGCTLDKVEKGAGTLGDVPTDPLEIVDAAYALEVGASLPYSATLTGEVVSIDTPYSAEYNNITVSIKVEGREDKPIMCYRMKGEGADTLMPGDTITVTGVIKNYNGTIEFDTGCSLDSVVKGENSFVMPTDPKEIVNLAYELGVGEALPVQVTLTGLINVVETPYSDRYGNISVWMVVEGMYDKPIQCFRMKGAGVDQIWEWDTITVTGVLKNYNGTIEFDAGCTLDSWVDTGANPDYPTTQKEIVDALYALESGESFPGIYSLTGRVVEAEAYSLFYGNQTITIDVEGKEVICYRMTTGGIEIKAGDYVTVRGNLEDYNGKKQLTSGYLTWYDETTLAEALVEASGLANNTYLPYESSVTGTVKINTPYSAQYKNITITVTDAEGNEVYCYRVKGYGMDQLVDGDVVTVTGKLTAYNGKPQFDSTATVTCERLVPKTLVDQLAAAANLKNGEYLPIESTITGTVKINTAYSAQYGNITITVTDADGVSAYCYRVKGEGMDTLADGDTVTVTGYLTAYNGKAQFDSTATVTVVAKADTETPEEPEVPEVPEEELKTLEQQLAAAAKLANGEYLSVESTVTGTVKIEDAYSAQYKNITFYVTNADGVEVYCYRVKGEGMDTLADGDTVTVTGKLTAYNGKAQFDSTASVTVVAKAEGGEEGDEGGSEGELTTVTISIADVASANGWENSKLYASFTVNGITVSSAGTGYNGNPLNTGKYYTSGNQWRIYQNENPTVTVTAGGKTIVSIKITYASNNSGVLTYNGTNVSSGTAVSVNGTSAAFSVGNTGTKTNGQARITSIEVTYAN